MGEVLGIDSTAVDTSDKHGVGVMGTPDGVNYYQYVEANEALANGEVATVDEVYKANLADTSETAPGTGQGKPAGVARASVNLGEFCWIQVCGTGDVQVAASCAAHTELNATGTGGELDDDATAGAEVIAGITLTAADGGSGGLVGAIIHYPYVGRTL